MIIFEVGDIVTIIGPSSLYRITNEENGYFSVNWIGSGDKNVRQANSYDQKNMNQRFRLYRKASKLERVLK